MRHILVMVLLGVTLALGAAAALAGDNTGDTSVNPFPSSQMQAPQAGQFAPAGPTSQPTTLQQYRLENIRQ